MFAENIPINSNLRVVPVMRQVENLNPFFDAVAEAVEESILNALCAAEDMVGYQGHQAYALPLDELQKVMAKYKARDC